MLSDWFFSDLDWFRIGFLVFQELAGFSSDSGFGRLVSQDLGLGVNQDLGI
jgi:hypothetical protein